MSKKIEALLNKTIGPVRVTVGGFALLFMIALLVFLGRASALHNYPFCAAACIFAMTWIVSRRFLGVRNLVEKTVFTLLIALLLIGVIHHNYYKPTVKLYQHSVIRTWNMYHYYIGSKYFDELGYHNLYLETVLADRQDKNRLKKITKVRDLTDYQKKPLTKILPDTRSAKWTDARWAEFKKDLRPFLIRANSRTWSRMLIDRGYNPTPFWNTLGSFVSHHLDAKINWQLLIATSIDFALYAMMFGFVVWAFGIEPAILVLLSFLLLPFNLGRIVGGYIQYDWMTAIVAGICCVKKRRPIAAAVFLGFATMARAFPLILTAGLGAPALKQLIKTRSLSRFNIAFVAAFLIVVMIGLVIGSFSASGFDGWAQWKSNIKLHNYEMTFGTGRIGLKHIFVHKLGDSEHWETVNQRKKMLPTQIKYYYPLAALFFLLFFPALFLQGRVNAIILSMVVAYILLVPSHYYWSILAVMPLWVLDEDAPWTPALIPSLTAFFVPAGWFLYAQTHTKQLAQYLRFDWLLGICLLVLMISILIRAYWHHWHPKPEIDSSNK